MSSEAYIGVEVIAVMKEKIWRTVPFIRVVLSFKEDLMIYLLTIWHPSKRVSRKHVYNQVHIGNSTKSLIACTICKSHTKHFDTLPFYVIVPYLSVIGVLKH